MVKIVATIDMEFPEFCGECDFEALVCEKGNSKETFSECLITSERLSDPRNCRGKKCPIVLY